MNYSELLKDIREEKGMTQKEVASELGISYKAYSMYETEYKVIPSKYLNPLCNLLDISIDYLLGISKNKKYSKYNKEINYNILKERLQEFKKNNKLTQVKLANILKTNQSVISDYENGKRLIPTLYLQKICQEYNISADYLLGKINYNPLSKSKNF